MSRYRVSMDIGGTFTDVVAYDEERGTYTAGKVLDDAAGPRPRASSRRSKQVVEHARDDRFTVHGTTRRAERVPAAPRREGPAARDAGASDMYQIARGNRTRLYDLHYRKPAPLVPRTRHRRDPRAAQLRAARSSSRSTTADVRAAAARARRGGLRRGRRRVPLQLRQPRARAAAPRRSCARSSTASRSRSRTASRASGASTSARRRRWSTPTRRRSSRATSSGSRAELRRRGLAVPLHVMQSSGGVMTAESARRAAVQTLLSGPVGGTMGGVALARMLEPPEPDLRRHGRHELRRQPRRRRQARRVDRDALEGLPLLMPIVEHPHDRRGRRLDRLRRGRRPARRAGERRRRSRARPATAAAGREPTVTDANLVLGRIDPETSPAAGWRSTSTRRAQAVATLGERARPRRAASWPRACSTSSTRRWRRRSAR